MRYDPNSTVRKILENDQAAQTLRQLKKRNGKRIVFTNGCFDLIHPGHAQFLAEARRLGDCLLVAVNSDRSVRAMKGPQRPLLPQAERAEILAALRAVDYVTIFDEPTPRELIARILPNILVKGSDWGETQIVGREEVEAAGGKVISIPVLPGYSTTAIIEAVLRQTHSDKIL
ncbi:MAG TPA: D-glycero-beta-D-manno-heptose 1-phosphate adenylyltransferase [Terriglobia bacterium]|nr:D-glycero-beta-D-manno-heptose 1-phosphate adenylyltransferase [Terriglobia bacterium]